MRGGILIIGSLLWDDDPPERAAWRDSRLLLDRRQSVVASLNYGRRSRGSRKRGNTFTMTFDAAPSGGSASVVPCASPACRAEDVVNEAEALWAAEDASAGPRALCATRGWGCVGALFRPGTPGHWLDHWRKAFRERVVSPVSPVDDHGLLQIAWPVQCAGTGGAVDLDFVLATANQRECTRPSAEAIADAWIDQQEGHERYFFENIRHAVRTSQDLAIWRRMCSQKAPWLDKPEYAEAVGILTAEEGAAYHAQ